MRPRSFLAIVFLVITACAVSALETTAVVRKVDVEKRTLEVVAGGQPHTLTIPADARFLDKDGKELAGGLRSAELKEGAQVTLTVDTTGGQPQLRVLRLGASAGANPTGGAPQDGSRVLRGQGRLEKVDVAGRSITWNLGGASRTLPVPADARILDEQGKALPDGLAGLKVGAEVTVTAEPGTNGPRVRTIQLGRAGAAGAGQPIVRVDTSRFKPLTELGTAEYQSFAGGLYPGGKNERPAPHEAAGVALAKSVRTLDSAGKLDPNGRIVLLTLGMSNASQASDAFRRVADADARKNPKVLIVNGAQGGMTAERIQNPDDGASGTEYWRVVDERLRAAGVSRAQVQAVWIKEADAGPNQGFPAYAKKLQGELQKICQLLPARFPNLKLAYLSSRIYGGYAHTPLNPEPYAYESGFSVKWLVEQQIKGDAALVFDPAKGAVRSPWLSWGPYLWANGTTKRADGLFFEESDLAGDGTHEAPSGQQKVAEQLLRFFKTDSTTKGWFVTPG